MKKLLLSLVLAGFTLLTLNACSTIAGAGKDLQRAGQAVEGEASKH